MIADESRAHRRRALVITAASIVIVFILWNLPQLDFVLYPFRLFVTFIHEAGHGLAAILSGGQFLRFEVFANGSGVATTIGGSRALILPAGYLGAALFGAVLFYAAHRMRFPRSIALVLGVLIALLSLLFGLSSATALGVGALFGLALIVMAWKANRDFNILVLSILAILTGLNAVLDLFFLISNSDMGIGPLRNDAAAFSAEVAPLVPPVIWALVWALLAVLLLGLAVWYGVLRPMRRG